MIPTIFVNAERRIIIEWEIIPASGFPAELHPDCCSYEVIDEYYNTLDALRDSLTRPVSFGLRLSAKSRRRIVEEQLYLSGDSMGAAWLLGALCFLKRKPFPQDLLIWGAIRPIRNGHFALYKTGSTRLKICKAIESRKQRIVYPEDEKGVFFPGLSLRLPADMQQTIRQLEVLIDE